jgi:enoyl-[acyl-carrier protein] reductase II
VLKLYQTHPTTEDLKNLLGRARAKKGMFEGDLEEGELEIGQIAGLIDEILTVENIVKQIVNEFNNATTEMKNLTL